MTDRISGSAFKQMVLFGAACITLEREAINDLNVFPVPDGDTGTNMSLTIQTAANELKKHHRLRSAARRERKLRRYPLPAVSGCVQVSQGR